MKFKKYFGYAMNVTVIAFILLFIVLGLNYIGLNNLPAPIEKLLGTYDEANNNTPRDDNAVYGAITGGEEKINTVSTAYISYENARKLLEKISVSRDFVQEISVENVFGEKIQSKRIVLEYDDGKYLAEVYDDNGMPEKTIKELENQVEVTYYHNFKEDTAKFDKGDFTVAEECGVILNSDVFLESGYELSEGEFLVENSEFGAVLKIEFTNEVDGYVSREIFRLSSDYGVVVSAQSYEGDNLVYSMKTEVLRFL